MKKLNFRGRFVVPMMSMLLLMLCSWTVYNLAWRLDNHLFHKTLAAFTGTILFVSVAFGALIVYPIAYFRGASLRERVIASSIAPFFWMIKECARLYISFTLPESLYYYFNPLNLWLALAICMEMSTAEIICRYILRRRGDKIRIVTLTAAATFGISILLMLLISIIGQGETIHARYLELYRFFFNAGAGIKEIP